MKESLSFMPEMESAKTVDEAHFLLFTAIIATWNGTEGSNFHIRDTMVYTNSNGTHVPFELVFHIVYTT